MEKLVRGSIAEVGIVLGVLLLLVLVLHVRLLFGLDLLCPAAEGKEEGPVNG